MGQQFHTGPLQRKISDFENGSNTSSPVKPQRNLLDQSQNEHKILASSSQSDEMENLEMPNGPLPDDKDVLLRFQRLIEFIGEIIYFCKLHMKKQRKYHYKISALLFYKYFYDKFRQLQQKYLELYEKNQIQKQQYQKRVSLVIQVKDTFVKIKKFIYSKIPFMSQKIRSFLNEDSQDYCFNRKDFFTQLLYPQVKEISQFYYLNTQGTFEDAGINTCYVRMIKAIFIIEELEFGNIVVEAKDKDLMPDYEIEKIQKATEQEIQRQLVKCYKTFITLERS